MQFTDEQIITAMTALISPLADRQHAALDRSDIAPYIVKDTGVWVDPACPGDENGPAEDYIGLAMFMLDAVDADTGDPFLVVVKVHKPSFCAAPKIYAMSLATNLARGVGKMQGAMAETARAQYAKNKEAMVEANIIH